MDYNYNKICNIYKHVTYIGSISSSLIIYLLLFFLNDCGSNIHALIHYLVLFKSFLLYDSSYLELLHHYVQYHSANLIFNSNITNCNPDIVNSLNITYCILFTPIFNNIKYYVPLNYKYSRLGLDLCTTISFFYYRSQFNYHFWFSNGFKSMGEYITINKNIENKIQTEIIEYIAFNLLCFMNVYWGYKIIRILKYKLCNIIKHD